MLKWELKIRKVIKDMNPCKIKNCDDYLSKPDATTEPIICTIGLSCSLHHKRKEVFIDCAPDLAKKIAEMINKRR